MGAYLSQPITKKISIDETGQNVAYGASSMQGWRVSQEDAHNCCINYDENASLFAVYDGHGGHEVAHYCSQKLPEFIKETDAYKRGDVRQALIDAFLGFDAMLTKPEIIKILKEIAGTKVSDTDKAETCDSDEVSHLRMEAEMPLEQLIGQYELISDEHKNQNCLQKSITSPCRKAKSCSGSSILWGTNEADVSSSSSSSQPCASTSGTNDTVKNKNDEQILHSTTSNGEVSHSQHNVGKRGVIKSELPDSSEDVNEHVSSKKEIKIEAEVKSNDKLNCDSSKVDGVSSTCTSVKNGKVCQLESISSSYRKTPLRREFIRQIMSSAKFEQFDDDDDDDDEDDKDDNENDIDDDNNNHDDDNDDEDNDEDDENDDTEDLDDDDDDSSMDAEFDDDEDDYESENNFSISEEPGSDSGCTAVVALLYGQNLYVANAGDSRCVLCRDGVAVELSLDHKPEDILEMERIVKAGGKVTADGRVNGGLNLSRAIGDHAYKQNSQLPPENQMISAVPDVRHISIDPKRDEFLILACDGIWNFMSSSEVVKFVKERIDDVGNNISKVCEELFDHCLSPDTTGDGTGCDNMTAVIVKFKDFTPILKNKIEIDEVEGTKKRRASQNLDSDESVTNNNPTDAEKRAKFEAVDRYQS